MPRRDEPNPNDALQALFQLPPALLVALVIAALLAFSVWEFYQHHGTAPAYSPGGNGTVSPASGAPIDVYFSPKGGCEQAVVAEVAKARQTIDLQAYSFTSKPIEQALIDAAHRGVAVRIVLDAKDALGSYSGASTVAAAGIPTWTDARHAIAHNKVIIIDRSTVLTGSFNFTNQAEHSNAENLVILHDRPDLAQKYENNFDVHLGHSEKYQPGEARPEARTPRPRNRTEDGEEGTGGPAARDTGSFQ